MQMHYNRYGHNLTYYNSNSYISNVGVFLAVSHQSTEFCLSGAKAFATLF